MNTIDFSPLLRSAIGFDRFARLLDGARAATEAQAYPPYNIEVTGEDSYALTLAVAGFRPEDLEVMVREDTLTISGKSQEPQGERRFLHRGIAGRAFERRFVLADHLVVQDARLENGLLHIALKREVPEALKPRRVAIQTAAPAPRPAIDQAA
jgi:molecular chaperone IbpA